MPSYFFDLPTCQNKAGNGWSVGLIDQYLSEAKIKKACDVFFQNSKPITDEYLSKFNIYCLIQKGKNEEAQLMLDLKSEQGFSDKYFERKISYLLGFTSKIDESISEKSMLDFHLAHKTNPNFEFEPGEKTDKIIWKYLSSANLLSSFKEIEITQLDIFDNPTGKIFRFNKKISPPFLKRVVNYGI